MVPEEIVDPAALARPALISTAGDGEKSADMREVELTCPHSPSDLADRRKRPHGVANQDSPFGLPSQLGYTESFGKIDGDRNLNHNILVSSQCTHRLGGVKVAGGGDQNQVDLRIEQSFLQFYATVIESPLAGEFLNRLLSARHDPAQMHTPDLGEGLDVLGGNPPGTH